MEQGILYEHQKNLKVRFVLKRFFLFSIKINDILATILDRLKRNMIDKRERIGDNDRIIADMCEYPRLYRSELIWPKIQIDIVVLLQGSMLKISSKKTYSTKSFQSMDNPSVSDNERIEIISCTFQSKFLIEKPECFPVPASQINDRTSFLQIEILFHDTQMIVE